MELRPADVAGARLWLGLAVLHVLLEASYILMEC